MARSSEYWAKRIASQIWKSYNSSEEEQRDLIEMYQDASRNILNEVYQLAEKYSKNGVLSRTELYKYNRLQELNKKIESILSDLGKAVEEKETSSLIKASKVIYKAVRTQIQGPDFSMPNQRVMKKMLQTPWRGDNFSSRLWKNQKKLAVILNDQLMTGIQQGKTATEIAINLNNQMGNGFNVAHRLVRTETMHYLNESAKEGYKDAGCKKVQFWAAEDERTCEQCGRLHEKIYELGKEPTLPLHPNCRCTYIPIVEENTDKSIEKDLRSDIIKLPRYTEAVIPKGKFVGYALNPQKDPNKARAFKEALGYTSENADELMQQIREKLSEYGAEEKGDRGYGMTYEVVMDITGPNKKTAKVLTAWIDDKNNGEMRLTTVHVDK